MFCKLQVVDWTGQNSMDEVYIVLFSNFAFFVNRASLFKSHHVAFYGG
jgi:hypothetical protein